MASVFSEIVTDAELRVQIFDSLVGSKWLFKLISRQRTPVRLLLMFLLVPFTIIQLMFAMVWIVTCG